jgi:ubiquitin-conjugating enzyme E2 S
MVDDNLNEIFAEINGPGKPEPHPVATPYERGLYKITLKISEEFPKVPPKGYFLTKIFHPNISDKGDICVNSLKKDWNPLDWNLKHILKIIHCLLINPFPESALNEEAGKMFMENYDGYFRRAQIFNEIHALSKAPAKPKRSPNAMDEVRR